MSTDRALKHVIERVELQRDAVAPPTPPDPEHIQACVVNEELESADNPPQTDGEWLAWLAKRGVK